MRCDLHLVQQPGHRTESEIRSLLLAGGIEYLYQRIDALNHKLRAIDSSGKVLSSFVCTLRAHGPSAVTHSLKSSSCLQSSWLVIRASARGARNCAFAMSTDITCCMSCRHAFASCGQLDANTSSLICALIGMDILPRKEGTCTRTPLEIHMRRKTKFDKEPGACLRSAVLLQSLESNAMLQQGRALRASRRRLPWI